MELFDLRNKNILITGAASNLGQAMARGLVGYGGRVFVTGRDLDRCEVVASEIDAGRCVALRMDVESDESVEDAFARAEAYGGVDVLINNAASIAPGRIEDMTYEAWTKSMDGTINSVFRTINQALKYMLPKASGNIINIGSMYGLVSPDPGIYGQSGQNSPPGYGAGKAAIIQLTRYVACHYGRSGIRANAVSPGPFPGEAARRDAGFILRLADKTALGRVGDHEEIMGVIVFLASDASSYITGQNISIDGGWTAW